MSDMVNVVICDGKYAIIQDESGNTNVLRYGEWWRNVTGDNVILGAAYEIDKLRERIKRLEDAGDEVSEILSSKTPKAHCVCHIAPPCSDCVEHWGSREALANWRKAKEAKL